ncbi:MAG: hypothetical protein IT556_10535 [Acetobacteraceae bacterium]|nr:hypothetical protein [Acetobacteraceae bacterium]
MIAVTDLRAYLAGDWRIERRIRDRRLCCDGLFSGQARFGAAGAGLRCEETGRLRFGDYQGQARRGTFYDFVAPHKANVTFEQGGLFHDLDLRSGLWRALHPCGPDLYRGRIAARSADCWQAAWWVSGPRKDQIMLATYRRV